MQQEFLQHLLVVFDACWFRKCVFIHRDGREGQVMMVCFLYILS